MELNINVKFKKLKNFENQLLNGEEDILGGTVDRNPPTNGGTD